MSVMTKDDHCDKPGKWQYVIAGHDGLNYLPGYVYCDDHIDEAQPPETTHVLPVDCDHPCDFFNDDYADAEHALYNVARPKLRVVTDDDNS